MFQLIFLLLATFCFGQDIPQSFTKSFKGFVALPNGHELYVEYQSPGAQQPTLVLLNGLDNNVRSWDALTSALDPNVGLLRFDFIGQGETLRRQGRVLEDIDYRDQAEDLASLLKKLQVTDRVDLLGFSYGGGIAAVFSASHPELFRNLILVAPFTEYNQKGHAWLQAQVAMTRLLNPFNPFSNEEIYDFFFRNVVFGIFPLVDRTLLQSPEKLNAIYHLIRGIRPLVAKDLVGALPDHSLNLVVAAKDKLVEPEVLARFWSSVPERVRGSRAFITAASHRVPEQTPLILAGWIKEIISTPPKARNCQELLVDPKPL